MAIAGTITKTKSSVMSTEISITGITGGNTSPAFTAEMLPYASLEYVLAAGTTPTSVQLQGSNDGVNFANLGLAVLTFPALAQLGAPMKFYQLVLTGGDTTTQFSVNAVFMGVRG